MADHDAILRRQRERMDEHRRWLEQQQAALRDLNTASASNKEQQPPFSAASGSPVGYAADQSAHHSPDTGRTTNSARSPHASARAAATGQRFGSSVGGGDRVLSPSNHQPTEGSYLSEERAYTSGRPAGSPLNVHARSTQWARRREQKLQELKAQREDDNEQDCPFAPDIHDIKYNSTSRRRVDVRGFENYLDRQESARVLKEGKALKIKCDGSRWTGAVTVPEEFQLGNRRPTAIKSLSQPLKAPSTRSAHDLRALLHDPAAPSGGALDAAAAVLPRGVFSSKSSAAIIDTTHREPSM